MLAYIFGIISYIGWGVGDIFGTIAARKIGGFQTTFWIMTLAAILFFPYAIMERNMLMTAPLAVILSAIAIGFTYQAGNVAVSEALRHSDASVVLTIMGSFGALVVLFSTLFLHEPMTPTQTIIIAVTFCGVFMTTWTRGVHMDATNIRGVTLALFAAICFGVFFTATKVFAPTLGWFWPLYVSFLWLPALYTFTASRGHKIRVTDLRSALSPIVWSMILLRGGDFIFNIGLQQGYAAIVAPVGTASPTLSVLLAFIMFKERLTKRQKAGIILALGGIVALGLVG